MLSYFLHIMRQKSGGSSFVCVQLLQTLNILFENIRNETSLCKLHACMSASRGGSTLNGALHTCAGSAHQTELK